MLRLPDGVTLDDVFAELPDIGNDPDIRAMVTDMHESGCSVYRAAANRFNKRRSALGIASSITIASLRAVVSAVNRASRN